VKLEKGGRGKGADTGASRMHNTLITAIFYQQGRMRTQAARADPVCFIWDCLTFNWGFPGGSVGK